MVFICRSSRMCTTCLRSPAAFVPARCVMLPHRPLPPSSEALPHPCRYSSLQRFHRMQPLAKLCLLGAKTCVRSFEQSPNLKTSSGSLVIGRSPPPPPPASSKPTPAQAQVQPSTASQPAPPARPERSGSVRPPVPPRSTILKAAPVVSVTSTPVSSMAEKRCVGSSPASHTW
jgi:hypothetical protein